MSPYQQLTKEWCNFNDPVTRFQMELDGVGMHLLSSFSEDGGDHVVEVNGVYSTLAPVTNVGELELDLCRYGDHLTRAKIFEKTIERRRAEMSRSLILMDAR